MSERLTARKIASAARVSRSTVQRALSGSPKVARAAKERILRIAEELGYRPNKHARALVLSRQRTEYAVVLTVPQNRFTGEVLRGIDRFRSEGEAGGAEFSVHLLDEIDGVRQAELLDALVSRGVRGIVFIPVDCGPVRRAVARGAAAGVTFVTLATDLPRSRRLCFVGQDNRASGRVGAELLGYLVRPGDEVALFAGSLQYRGHAQRIEGFRERFLESRQAADVVAILENHDSAPESERLARGLLDAHPRLRGIFVAGGGIEGLCGVLAERRARGGEPVRVVGYDLVQCARPCKDGLIDFVIDQDPAEEGYRALRLLDAHVLLGERPAPDQLRPIDVRTREILLSSERKRPTPRRRA